VAEVEPRVLFQMTAQVLCHPVERRRAPRREDDEMAASHRGLTVLLGRFLQDEVCVGASDAEGTDARPSRLPAFDLPGREQTVDVEGRGGELYPGVGRVVMERGRSRTVSERAD